MQRHDISDDEIRIISPLGTANAAKSRSKLILWCVIAVAVVAVGALVLYLYLPDAPSAEPDLLVEEIVSPAGEAPTPTADSTAAPAAQGYVNAIDTVVNGVGLRILTPEMATPILAIGPETLADTSAVMIVQAADVRGDNGQIAGACVVEGNLISRGEAKAGFCAIINGELSIGTADATPMLEQAIESEGYFFRQYPLVVGGQLVENKPKGVALRKALAEIDGRIRVVLSNERLTFHDFAQALIDAGARNAIYLVGSRAAGIYRDADGNRYKFGAESPSPYDHINYLVWK